MGGLFVVQGVMQLPGGVLISRYGTRRIVPLMSMLAGAGSLLIAFASSEGALFLGRAIVGLGFATAMVGGYVVIQSWRGAEALSTYTGRFLFVGSVGSLSATYPLGWAISVFEWRSVFAALGLITLVMAALAYVIVRDQPSALHTDRRPAGRTEIPSFRSAFVALAEVLRERRARPALLVAPFLYAPMQILTGLWAGPFLADVHGVQAVDRAAILFMMASAFAAGTLGYGPVERMLNSRRSLILAGLAAISAMLLALAAGGYASLWSAVVLFVLVNLAAPVFVLVFSHTQALFSPAHAGLVLPVINLLGVTGIFVTQAVSGQIIGLLTDVSGVTGSELAYRIVFGLVGLIFFANTLIYARTAEIPPRDSAMTSPG